MEISEIRKALQIYSVEEIAEYNNVLIEDLLETLIDEYDWKLPEPAPL